jgi:2-succinyl-5-enolpyruvyl-6-hydroxy-3-cyclohexene-1-carboxylate synthase
MANPGCCAKHFCALAKNTHKHLVFGMQMTSSSNDATAQATAYANSLRAAVVMGVLQKAGVGMCVISPGSRSAPLVLAAARTAGLKTWVAIDERSAGFLALGYARRSGQPVALICTSGSAPAHYFPAVIEASEAGIPLIVLSADRPPELRDCAAGQTIDQTRLFGDFVRHFFDLGLALDEESDPAYVRNRILTAMTFAAGSNPGPVQLNLPFREPLVPDPQAPILSDTAHIKQKLEAILAGLDASTFASASFVDAFSNGQLSDLFSHKRGIILVGAHPPLGGGEAFSEALFEIANKLGWPLFADAAAAPRFHVSASSSVIAHYDVLLRDPDLAQSMQPDFVLQVGALPTAKVLRQWLKINPFPTVIIDPRPRNLDPLQRSHQHWQTTIQSLAKALAQMPNTPSKADWLELWTSMDRAATTAMQSVLAEKQSSADCLSEPMWPHLLVQALDGITCDLHFASSMPVRDAEWLLPSGSIRGEGFANRGANGIDGTLSTALGAAAASSRPMVLVCGDLAFLHDSNALLNATQFKGNLTVLLIDNRGGRIFESLPIARQESDFEHYFATPQRVDFAQLAAAHQVPFIDLQAVDAVQAIRQSVSKNGLRILRLQSDNKVAMQLRRELFAAMTQAAILQLNPNSP